MKKAPRTLDIVERLRKAPVAVGHAMFDAHELLEDAAKEICRLRDVLTWTEDNCPGKCAGVVGAALRKRS